MTDWLDEQMEDILSGNYLPRDEYEEWQLRQEDPWNEDEEDEDSVWTLSDMSYEWTGVTDLYEP